MSASAGETGGPNPVNGGFHDGGDEASWLKGVEDVLVLLEEEMIMECRCDRASLHVDDGPRRSESKVRRSKASKARQRPRPQIQRPSTPTPPKLLRPNLPAKAVSVPSKLSSPGVVMSREDSLRLLAGGPGLGSSLRTEFKRRSFACRTA